MVRNPLLQVDWFFCCVYLIRFHDPNLDQKFNFCSINPFLNMEENIIKLSWALGILLVIFAVIHKVFGVGLIPQVTSISSYFHAANTCLLFGILFSLNNRP